MRISDWSSDVCSSDLPYRDFVGEGRLAAARGVRVDAREQRRARHIRDLLCNGRTHLDAAEIASAREALSDFEQKGVIEWDGEALLIRDCGLPYARHIAAQFDGVRGQVCQIGRAHV